jgi:hypothetical protein
MKGILCTLLRRCYCEELRLPATALESTALPSLCRRSVGADEHCESGLYTLGSTASYNQQRIEIRRAAADRPQVRQLADRSGGQFGAFTSIFGTSALARVFQLIWAHALVQPGEEDHPNLLRPDTTPGRSV